MNLVELIMSIVAPKPVYCPKRRGPSEANLRSARRILEHRLRNWPNAVAVPHSRAHYLPVLRKGGGQREAGA